ncbi:MAG: hypothetical protein SXU28_02330 [Pseudomonadota bacterium]|nr:hypothetical protein [Pseudomonadota bacterium]
MQVSPFLEIFVGLFLVFGLSTGWFTRARVWAFAIVIGLVVFALWAFLESQNPPANPGLTVENVQVAALIGCLAAIPAFLSAGLARIIKRRRET